MRRITWPLALVSLLLPAALFGQSKEDMIASALSAAPASIADHATVTDLEGNMLREGSNGWTCMPDNADMEGNDPMCLDDPWLEFLDAWVNKGTPEYDRMGFGYMLQAGGPPGSNTDPYAEGPTEDNEWMSEPGPPHIMIVVPNAEWLEGLPTTPEGGGPWVMWKDTPLAHVMIPTVGKGH